MIYRPVSLPCSLFLISCSLFLILFSSSELLSCITPLFFIPCSSSLDPHPFLIVRTPHRAVPMRTILQIAAAPHTVSSTCISASYRTPDNAISYNTILHCTTLWCTMLYCTILTAECCAKLDDARHHQFEQKQMAPRVGRSHWQQVRTVNVRWLSVF